MERIIYDNLINKIIILDSNHKVIENIIPDSFKIKDIDFNSLPSNIYTKPKMYLGNNYESHKFELKIFKEFLFGDNVYKEEKNGWYYRNKEQLYTFDNKSEILILSDHLILYPYSRKFKYNDTLVRCLCGALIGYHYNLNIDIVF